MSNEVFTCMQMLFDEYCDKASVVHEFGSGDGVPMINALLATSFKGMIHGYEISDASWNLAKTQIERSLTEERYQVHLSDFFEVCPKSCSCILVSNPPYLPAWPDTGLYMKELYGGIDGTMISRKLLSLKYRTVLLLVSSFSNPVDLLQYAAELGYEIANFLIKPLPFGHYSSQPEVKARIMELYRERTAFFSEHYYLLAGVIFQKKECANMELFTNLIEIMQSLQQNL